MSTLQLALQIRQGQRLSARTVLFDIVQAERLFTRGLQLRIHGDEFLIVLIVGGDVVGVSVDLIRGIHLSLSSGCCTEVHAVALNQGCLVYIYV